MASSILTPIITLLLLLLLLSPSFALLPPPSSLSTPHRSPPIKSTSPTPATGISTAFLSTLHSTLNQIQQVTSIVSTFSGTLGGDLRLSSAISDCLDLLDFSSDELSWSISSSGAAAATAAVNSGTGEPRADLRSWLSAALGNQDTCKESLSSTGSLLASLASSGLDAITSLLSQGIRQLPAGGVGRRRLMGGFPAWVAVAERKMLQAGSVAANVTVAKDGSGNFATVNAAVAAAPEESGRRFVIYVKRGVYVENVEIKKKKWNLMFVGDGMDATVISGSRNFVDGWTTFRSATFGK